MADVVKSVNGKTGDVVLSAADIEVAPGGAKNIEQVINSAYVASVTVIESSDDYLLTISKRS